MVNNELFQNGALILSRLSYLYDQIVELPSSKGLIDWHGFAAKNIYYYINGLSKYYCYCISVARVIKDIHFLLEYLRCSAFISLLKALSL